MAPSPFVGRKVELEQLKTLHQKNTPSLVVIRGRRRIGKSRLIQFFASQYPTSQLWDFSGLAPQEGVDAQTQRDHFARRLASHLNLPPFTFQDWTDAFEHLSAYFKTGDIVLLDEISWMASDDPSFIPKLKAWWDQQHLSVMLVLCGSVSTWIDTNILNDTAFFGRIHLTLTLNPLPIPDAYQLLKGCGFQGSHHDAFKLLSVFGGVPWYLEQVVPGQTADALMKRLCFEKDGLLVLEFDRIFHDLFKTKGSSYQKILDVLKGGIKTLREVRQALQFPHSGTLSQLMAHLITAGFVSKQQLWSFKTAKPLKQSLYRIGDPYMRFYLNVIAPQRHKIDLGGFQDTLISKLPGFEAHMGLQLEYLLLQNRMLLLQGMGIMPTEVICDGPYRQSKTSRQPGCQIDYLVQTATKNLFVCEFKFKRQEVGVELISQAQNKIDALKVPRGFAAIPVLFYVGGVTSELATNPYFYKIIDVTDFLQTA